MEKFNSIGPVVLFVSFLFNTFPSAQEWYTTVVDSDGDVGLCSDIALDSTDSPHISYFDADNADLKYAYWDGNDWQIQSPDPAGTVGRFCSIALDSNNHPHISYRDSSVQELKYAFCDGTGWHIECVDLLGVHHGGRTAIAVDSNDRPHISYTRVITHYSGGMRPWYEYGIKYAYWNGYGWEVFTIDSQDYHGLYNADLALDENDRPFITYYNQDFSELKCAYKDDLGWHTDTVDGYGLGSRSSITVDSNGCPHVSYCRAMEYGSYTDYDLKYAFKNGGSWDSEYVDTEGWAGNHNSITLDLSGYPKIAYYDRQNGGNLKYASWNGSDWDISVVDNSGDVGKYTSIEYSRKNGPYISYYNETNGSLKLAWYGTPYIRVKLLSFSAEPIAGNRVKLDWSVENTGGVLIDGFDLYRADGGKSRFNTGDRTNTDKDESIGTKINEELITGWSPYTYIDAGLIRNTVYEYVLEAVSIDNSEVIGEVKCEVGSGPAGKFSLFQSRPNPTKGWATIGFVLNEQTDVTLTVYDLSGRQLIKLADGVTLPPGEHDVRTPRLAPGVYIYRIDAGGFRATKKMVVIR